jgi:hypothetical protein
MKWKSIETVDYQRPVWLRAPGVGPVLMQWSFGRHCWTGSGIDSREHENTNRVAGATAAGSAPFARKFDPSGSI